MFICFFPPKRVTGIPGTLELACSHSFRTGRSSGNDSAQWMANFWERTCFASHLENKTRALWSWQECGCFFETGWLWLVHWTKRRICLESVLIWLLSVLIADGSNWWGNPWDNWLSRPDLVQMGSSLRGSPNIKKTGQRAPYRAARKSL